MEFQVAPAPIAWDNNHRADIAELTCDSPCEAGPFVELALSPLSARAKDNGVICFGASRYMNLINSHVLTEISPHISTAIDQLQITIFNERSKSLFYKNSNVVINRTQLKEADFPLNKQLVYNIERGDAGDVARAQYETDPAFGLTLFVKRSHCLAQPIETNIGLHPNLGAKSPIENFIKSIIRKDLNHYLPIRSSTNHLRTNPRDSITRYPSETLAEQSEIAYHNQGTGNPFLRRLRGIGRNALGFERLSDLTVGYRQYSLYQLAH